MNGLSFKGVTFGFEIGGIPSADARYHALGPGSMTYVRDPSLEGASAGTLTLSFDRPTTLVEFGIARNCFCILQGQAPSSTSTGRAKRTGSASPRR